MEQHVVSAVAAFTGHGDIEPDRQAFNKRLQDAMMEAAGKAQAEGISDPDIIRDRMLAARDAILKE